MAIKKYNASGCKDPTAFEALSKIEAEEQAEIRCKNLLRTIFYICNLAGVYVEDITLKDLKTEKKFSNEKRG